MRFRLCLAVICVLIASISQVSAAPAGLIAPAAVHMPYGGTVVTEINITDNDVLGIIKRTIPAVGDILKTMAQGEDSSGNLEDNPLPLFANLDMRQLSEAINDVHSVRILVIRYGRKIPAAQFVREFDAGVAKTGTFSRVLSDVAMLPGATGLYAESDNKGYIGFSYDQQGKTAYAVRMMGSIDVEKLVGWIGDIFKQIQERSQSDEQDSSDEDPAPKPQKGL